MKVLLSWMREFAPVEGEPESLAEAMTDLGMVVEHVQLVSKSGGKSGDWERDEG